MRLHTKTIRKEIEKRLEVYSIEEVLIDCKIVLRDLRKYPTDNVNQIRYYERYWSLLNEY